MKETFSLHDRECMLQRFFQFCLGIRVLLLHIPSLPLTLTIRILSIRRRMLASAFPGRLLNIQGDDWATRRQNFRAGKNQMALNASELFRLIAPLETQPLEKNVLFHRSKISEKEFERTCDVHCLKSWRRFFRVCVISLFQVMSYPFIIE